MSDFHLYLDVTRGEVAESIADNPDHAAWVLGRLSERLDPAELPDFLPCMDADPGEAAAFYRRLAHELDAQGGAVTPTAGLEWRQVGQKGVAFAAEAFGVPDFYGVARDRSGDWCVSVVAAGGQLLLDGFENQAAARDHALQDYRGRIAALFPNA